MKYHLRTVIWKFKDVSVHHPDLKMQKDIIISNPDDMFIHFSPLFQNQVRERFIVLWLSSANKVMSFEVVSEGSLNASIVHPREVFRGAIVTQRHAIATNGHILAIVPIKTEESDTQGSLSVDALKLGR
jgi:DNA repair protein RadC